MEDRKLDYVGIAILTTGLLALLLALDQGTSLGWLHPRIIGFFAVAAIFLGAFGFVEQRVGSRALVPPDVMRNSAFMAATGALLLVSALIFATFFYLPQYMMKHLGFSAAAAGLGLLPLLGVFAATSFASGPLYNWAGAKFTVTLGAFALAAGVFSLTVIAGGPSYGYLVPGMIIVGIGTGLFFSAITTAGITSVDTSKSSLAGAILYMAQIAGGSIGLALNTAIVASAPSLPSGISRAFLLDGCLAALGVLVSLLFIGGTANPERVKNFIHRHRAHV